MLAVRPSATIDFSPESLTDPSDNLFSQIDGYQHNDHWSRRCWADIYVALHEGLDVSQVPRSPNGVPHDSIGHFLVTRAYSCAARLDMCIRRGCSVATCCDMRNRTVLQRMVDTTFFTALSKPTTLCSVQVLADAGARLQHDDNTAKDTMLSVDRYLKEWYFFISKSGPIIEQVVGIFDNKTLP
jgi:hypothetical protein